MKLLKKAKADFDKKFKKVSDAPEGFGFFEAVHDFVECIEENKILASDLTYKSKESRELNIPAKYGYLHQIYQGLEDAHAKTNKDLGHARYMNVKDLGKIQNKEFSESNFFWRKRALFRKFVGEIYERVTTNA